MRSMFVVLKFVLRCKDENNFPMLPNFWEEILKIFFQEHLHYMRSCKNPAF